MPLPRESQQFGELRIVERRRLGGGLHFHQASGTGHHDVHVDIRARIFLIAEVQHEFAADDLPALVAATESRIGEIFSAFRNFSSLLTALESAR